MVSASLLKTADFKISVWTQKYTSLHIFRYTRVVTRNQWLDCRQSFHFTSNQGRKIQRRKQSQTLLGSCILLFWNQKGKRWKRLGFLSSLQNQQTWVVISFGGERKCRWKSEVFICSLSIFLCKEIWWTPFLHETKKSLQYSQWLYKPECDLIV